MPPALSMAAFIIVNDLSAQQEQHIKRRNGHHSCRIWNTPDNSGVFLWRLHGTAFSTVTIQDGTNNDNDKL